MAYKCGYNILDEKLLMAIGQGATEAEARRAVNTDMMNEIKGTLDEVLNVPCPQNCAYQTFRGGVDPNPWKAKCVKFEGVWACIAGTHFWGIIRCRDVGIKIGKSLRDGKVNRVKTEKIEKYLKKLDIKHEA